MLCFINIKCTFTMKGNQTDVNMIIALLVVKIDDPLLTRYIFQDPPYNWKKIPSPRERMRLGLGPTVFGVELVLPQYGCH